MHDLYLAIAAKHTSVSGQKKPDNRALLRAPAIVCILFYQDTVYIPPAVGVQSAATALQRTIQHEIS
ncbi:hypothetical protein D3C71_1880920 [compost metagenome]